MQSFLISIIILIYFLCKTQSSNLFWILLTISFLIGFLLIIPYWGSRYASCEFLCLILTPGWAAAGIGFTLENTLIITGALVGSSTWCNFILYNV